MSDAEHLEPVLELHLRGPTLFDLAQHASHTVLRQAAIADRRSFLDALSTRTKASQPPCCQRLVSMTFVALERHRQPFRV
jgi:hypothetical protein